MLVATATIRSTPSGRRFTVYNIKLPICRLAPLDHREMSDLRVHKVTLACKAPRVIADRRGYRGQRVTRVMSVPRGRKATSVRLAMMARQDRRGHRATLGHKAHKGFRG